MGRFLLTTMVASAIIGAGCGQTPVDPPADTGKNLLINGSFVTTVPDDAPNVAPGLVEPWAAGSYSPQICGWQGCDGAKGYLQMWGCKDLGEAIVQVLGTPIRAGHTYRVRANIRWYEERPGMHIRTTTVRFMAFNTAVTGGYPYWPANASTRQAGTATIGQITTGDTDCKVYELPRWVADNDYGAFGFNVENDRYQDGTPLNQSWAHIDDVELIEVALPY